MSAQASMIKKFFQDKDGKIVLGQSPNLPIIGWFVSLVLSFALHSGSISNGFKSLSSAFLLLWAYLEITDGVSYFRRFLGVIVAVVVLTGYFI